jgi:hypothetical protein
MKGRTYVKNTNAIHVHVAIHEMHNSLFVCLFVFFNNKLLHIVKLLHCHSEYGWSVLQSTVSSPCLRTEVLWKATCHCQFKYMYQVCIVHSYSNGKSKYECLSDCYDIHAFNLQQQKKCCPNLQGWHTGWSLFRYKTFSEEIVIISQINISVA